LQENFFVYADFSWLSEHSYHVIGKYNDKGQYMVHRVYICTNLNFPFVVQNYHQLEGCDNNNIVIPGSYSSVLNKQIEFKEGDPIFLVSTTLLQSDIDKDHVYFNHGAYMLAIFLREMKHYTTGNTIHPCSQLFWFPLFLQPYSPLCCAGLVSSTIDIKDDFSSKRGG
jgi:hypothetical protein